MRFLLTLVLLGFALYSTGQESSAQECPSIEPLPHELNGKGFYKTSDSTRSTLDEELKKAYDVAVAPLNRSLRELGRLSDRYVEDPKSLLRTCLERAFTASADRDALLGREEATQGHYLRQWTLATLAIVKFKAGAFDAADEKRARRWLTLVGRKVIRYHEGRAAEHRNNHFYWAVLGVGLAGMLIEDAQFIKFAEDGYRLSLESIDRMGILEGEAKRGERAAHYHAFAAQPLALYRVFRRLHGYRPLPQEGRLDTLIALVRKAEKDTSLIEKAAGVRQLPIGEQYWLDFIDALEQDPSRTVGGRTVRLGGSLDALRKAVQQHGQR